MTDTRYQDSDLRTRDFLPFLGADDLGQLVGDVEFLLHKHFALETEINSNVSSFTWSPAFLVAISSACCLSGGGVVCS